MSPQRQAILPMGVIGVVIQKPEMALRFVETLLKEYEVYMFFEVLLAAP